MTSKPFNNEVIAPKRADKPNIVARNGWWRVSKLPKKHYGNFEVQLRWYKAHSHVDRMNHTNLPGMKDL